MLKIAGIFFVFAAALLAAGWAYQLISSRMDQRRFPPPGSTIPIGDHALHIVCAGDGGATIILEAGAGGTSLDWMLVQPALAGKARVCAYDRAGLGWSESGPKPRTTGQIVSELHSLLDAAEISPPYIYVGHSFGGLIAQHYARAYPDEIAGLVLVDAVDLSFLENAREDLARQRKQQLTVLGVGAPLARFGFIRLLKLVRLPPNTPEPVRPVVAALNYRTATAQTVYDEAVGFEESANEIRALPNLRKDLPVRIVSRAGDPNAESAERDFWRRTQDALAQLTDNTKTYLSASQDHYIQFADPNIIVDAVEGIMQTNEK